MDSRYIMNINQAFSLLKQKTPRLQIEFNWTMWGSVKSSHHSLGLQLHQLRGFINALHIPAEFWGLWRTSVESRELKISKGLPKILLQQFLSLVELCHSRIDTGIQLQEWPLKFNWINNLNYKSRLIINSFNVWQPPIAKHCPSLLCFSPPPTNIPPLLPLTNACIGHVRARVLPSLCVLLPLSRDVGKQHVTSLPKSPAASLAANSDPQLPHHCWKDSCMPCHSANNTCLPPHHPTPVHTPCHGWWWYHLGTEINGWEQEKVRQMGNGASRQGNGEQAGRGKGGTGGACLNSLLPVFFYSIPNGGSMCCLCFFSFHFE